MILCSRPPPLFKVASNTRPCSKLAGTTLNGRRRGVSILSHRPVTSSDLKQDRLFFRESVSKFLQLVEALYMGGSRVPSSYLIGTMLLESYVPYWSISFNTEDISQEEGRRWPTAKQVSDLMSGFKSIPLANVTSVSIGNGGVSYSVVKVTTDDWLGALFVNFR